MKKAVIGFASIILITGLVGCQSTMVVPDQPQDVLCTDYECILYKCGDVVKMYDSGNTWWGVYANDDVVASKLADLHNGEFAKAVIDIQKYTDGFAGECDMCVKDVKSLQIIAVEDILQDTEQTMLKKYNTTMDKPDFHTMFYYDGYIISNDCVAKKDMKNQAVKYYLYDGLDFVGCFDTIAQVNTYLVDSEKGD